MAEIEHVGIAPVAAGRSGNLLQLLLRRGEQYLGNSQILDIVNLVPVRAGDRHTLYVGSVNERQYAKHLFIILVLTQDAHIGVQEGEVVVLYELA